MNTSDKDAILQLRLDFEQKEFKYKQKIEKLRSEISKANDQLKESSTELSFAFANQEKNDYAHLEQSEREQVLRRDLQIKLLKDRIA